MKIKMELELSAELLVQLQRRADYLNERYNTGTMITVKDLIKELISLSNVESLILLQYEEKITINSMEAYKEIFD